MQVCLSKQLQQSCAEKYQHCINALTRHSFISTRQHAYRIRILLYQTERYHPNTCALVTANRQPNPIRRTSSSCVILSRCRSALLRSVTTTDLGVRRRWGVEMQRGGARGRRLEKALSYGKLCEIRTKCQRIGL